MRVRHTRTSCSFGRSRKNSSAYRLHAFLKSPSDKLLPARVMMAMRAWVLRFARRSRRNPCAWSGSCTSCLGSSRTLFCTRSAWSLSLSPFCQRIQDHIYSHLQWPHLRVPVRHRHPMLGLSACSKHVAQVTELERLNRGHSFTFLR